jgi:hypothetical protein
MRFRALAAVSVIAIGTFTVCAAADDPGKAAFPEIADCSHATAGATAFFHSFFTAKSRHSVEATMDHFSRLKLMYVDATLGWAFDSYDAMTAVFATYMPKWPPSGLSYPTRILGTEHSALVAFTDTPELFGGEIRVLAAVDMEGGKVVRWIDYWDARSFGADLASTLRTPADKFPTDFKETSVAGNASARIRAAATNLQAAFAGNDAKRAASLFSYDAVYEDMAVRTQILGRSAIERYLGRALGKLPAGEGSSLLHVVGGDMGGGYEWQASPACQTTVRRGITALELNQDGEISRLTTVWDGAMIPDPQLRALVVLSLD